MISREDIENLAGLARLSLTEAEKDKLQKDMGSILGYISELSKAPVGSEVKRDYYTKNVLREDDNPNTPGEYREDILAEAPKRTGNYFAVKKILDN